MSGHSIVVCAFGPAATTRTAVQRARRIAGPSGSVVVFAAHAGVADSVRNLPAGAARRIDGHGTPAAAAALASLDGPVLFVHDDVLITPDGVRALARAERGEGVAVPWTNDLGVDHYLGSLPKVRAGDGALRRAGQAAPKPPAKAARYRPSCAYGDVRALAALLNNELIYAGTIIEDAVLPATVVAGAIASHDGSCVEQLLPPVGRDGRPLLVASLIVRDEERMLPECLASLEGVVDRIEICDTGSTDATIEIARAAGASVIERTWRDDFAWARNEGLSQCQDAWFVLVLDADERLVCADPVMLRRRLATAAGDGRSYMMKVSNIEDIGAGQTGRSSSMGARVFPPTEVHYEGLIHEQPVAIDKTRSVSWTLLEGVSLEHHGYRMEVFEAKNKAERNISLARRAYEVAPSPQTAMNYGRALTTAGADLALQVRLYSEALADADYFTPAARASLLTRLGEVHLALQQAEQALGCAREALDLLPGDDAALAMHGDAARALGRNDLIIDAARRSREETSTRPVYASDVTWGAARSREVEALLRVGQFEEAFAALEEILRVKPESFDGWAALADSLFAASPEDALGLMVQLSVIGGAVGAFRAIGERSSPVTIAECGAAYVQMGGREPHVVQLAFAATLVARRWDIYEALSPAAFVLERQAVENIVERATQRGAANPALPLLATAGVA